MVSRGALFPARFAIDCYRRQTWPARELVILVDRETPALIAHLSGTEGARSWSPAAFEDPVRWALDLLGFTAGADPDPFRPERADVQRRFRVLLRQAHPDHGADADGAAQRIADLTEARRILLA